MAVSIVIWSLVLHALTSHANAFQWTSDVQPHATLRHCVGDNVTFPWSYVTESEEKVIVQFWFSNRNGSFASYFADQFVTSSGRVKQAGNAGMTLSDVCKEDEDTYGVRMKLAGRREVLTSEASLFVIEPPRTTDGQLQIQLHTQDALLTGNTSCSHMRLTCGNFESPGSPPVTVLWTDPEGRSFPATDFQDGVFVLDLPLHAKGGNYTCRMDPESEAARCLTDDVPLLEEARLVVETMDSAVKRQTEELQLLTNTVQRLTHATFSDRTGHVDSLRQEVGTLSGQVSQYQQAQDQASQTVADLLKRVEHLEAASQRQMNVDGNLHSLVSSLQSQVADLQTENKDKGQQMSRLQSQVSEQNTQISSLKSQVSDQNTQISRLQSQVSDQNTQISRLQSQVGSLQSQVSEQNTQISNLQNTVSDLEGDNRHQDTQISSLTSQLSDLQGNIRDHRRQIPGLQSTVADLEGSIRDQFSQISSLQSQVADHNSQISNLNNTVSGQSVEVVSLKDQLHDQASRTDSLQHTVSDLQAASADLSAKVSQLDEMPQSLAHHVTEATKESETIKSRLALVESNMTSLLTSYEATVKRVQELEENVENVQQNRTGREEMTSLENNVSSLQDRISQGEGTVRTLQAELADLQALTSQLHPVRLVGGSSDREGRVEVLVGHQWGSVCDDGWDNNDAMVVCGMLGYSRVGAAARTQAAFGQGTGPIVLDDVECRGQEADIRQCHANTFGIHNCQHSEDAGVVCLP